MAAGSPRREQPAALSPGAGRQPDALSEGLDRWLRTLQQALQLEARQGCGDLMGRQQRFSAFMAASLGDPPSALAMADRQRLQPLREGFAEYGALSPGRRQTLVRQCRERLHLLRQSVEPHAAATGSPRLRLLAPAEKALAPTVAAGGALQPETPLAEIRGVGPRTATRLAALGLLVVRDLVHYYPRDYLDYANLVRISGLEPGRTATLVAELRRVTAFVSPRNPNLAILELQLADPTGRLRVSKFFAGKRFASPAWLRSQQRLYPLGASVAVSGLVKQTPYGPAFQDPLMEVLDSPR
ncbi:MAG: DNA helicase RecG, partial [Cyanobacteriota bacterium]